MQDDLPYVASVAVRDSRTVINVRH